MAARYWALKSLGTVEGLAEEFGVSKPTLIKYANEFPAASGGGQD